MDSRRRVVVFCLMLGLFAGFDAQAEPPPVEVPPDLAKILQTAQTQLSEDKPKLALRTLQAYTGTPHAMQQLLKGHILFEQNSLEAALKAYRQALQLDPDLKPAGMGIARIFVVQKNWKKAVPVFARWTSMASADLNELKLYARAAYEIGDRRLSNLIVQSSMMRFPNDQDLRLLDLALLIDDEHLTDAHAAARSMLRQTPDSTKLWRHLAVAAESQSDNSARLASIEAAFLANPKDRGIFTHHVMNQLDVGHHNNALVLMTRRIQAKPRDLKLLALGARVADAAQKRDIAQTWINKIPRDKRDRATQILEIRLLVHSQKTTEARKALTRLIQEGESNGALTIWAARLAEQDRAFAEAETYYRQVMTEDDSTSRLAVLYLARLLNRTHRREDARVLLSTYLVDHPGDDTARALLSAL